MAFRKVPEQSRQLLNSRLTQKHYLHGHNKDFLVLKPLVFWDNWHTSTNLILTLLRGLDTRRMYSIKQTLEQTHWTQTQTVSMSPQNITIWPRSAPPPVVLQDFKPDCFNLSGGRANFSKISIPYHIKNTEKIKESILTTTTHS